MKKDTKKTSSSMPKKQMDTKQDKKLVNKMVKKGCMKQGVNLMNKENKSSASMKTNYNEDINKARAEKNNQRGESNPFIEKEGFLGMDDLDKIRRRSIKQF